MDAPKTYALPGLADTIAELNSFGTVIANSLYYLTVAIVLVFIAQSLARKFIFPHLASKRHAVVLILALHGLILVSALLLVMGRLGFDISVIAPAALLIVLMVAILIFIIAPVLPKLPFKIGHMVEIEGILGNVATVTPMFTRIQTFDGRTVYIPNATVWAKTIINYHSTPNRRIELNLKVSADHSLAQARALLTTMMLSDERILNDPAPATRVNSARAEGVDIIGLCWVSNADFLGVRSDLYDQLVNAAQSEAGISLAHDQHVVLSGEITSH